MSQYCHFIQMCGEQLHKRKLNTIHIDNNNLIQYHKSLTTANNNLFFMAFKISK